MRITITLKRIKITISSTKKAAPADTKSGNPRKG